MSSSIPTEGPYLDILARFLRIATEEPSAIPEDALAEAFGKAFFPADIETRFQLAHQDEIFEEKTGAWADRRQGKPSAGPTPAAAPLVAWIEGRPKENLRFDQASSEDAERFRVVHRRPGGFKQELEIVFRRARELGLVDRISDFRRNIAGATVLFQALLSLKAARLAPSPRTSYDSFLEHLRVARSDIGRFLAYGGTDNLVELEVELVTNEMFGLGKDIEGLASDEVAEELSAFEVRVGEAKERRSPKLHALWQILLAASGKRPAAEEPRVADVDDFQILTAIASWTYLHARTQIAIQQDVPAEEGDLRKEIEQGCFALPAILNHQRSKQKGTGTRTAILSCWLRLWFCAELWHSIDEKEESRNSDERWRLYADLTYVARESLRGMLYGNRAEFRFQPVALASALRTMVEQHAVWVLRLPQALELWGILREIGSISLGGGPLYASGHLQHVLEMYISGMWLSAIKVKCRNMPAIDGASMCQVLAGAGAWKPAEGKQQDFQKAFGLAVLLHDIGTLFFPFWPRRAEDLAQIDGPARKRLSAIRSVLDQNVEQLLTTCERELVEAGIYDPAKEPKVHEWIEDCIDRGQADHSVLGAWYLVRVAKNSPGLQNSVVRQAARAILFHGINTQRIRIDEDPVAALLVFCDELIVWRQSHEPPASSGPGRYVYSMSSEQRPQESIFRDLCLPGLEGSLVGSHGSKRLVFTFDVETNQATVSEGLQDGTWPIVKASLQQPDRLPTAVYKLWLLTSQNLGRIVPLSHIRFGPVLDVSSMVPSRHRLSIRKIFVRVVPRAGLNLRPCLQRWLSQYSVAPPCSLGSNGNLASKTESAAFGPAQAFCEHSLAPIFPELERLAEAVIQEEILKSQQPHQQKRDEPESSS